METQYVATINAHNLAPEFCNTNGQKSIYKNSFSGNKMKKNKVTVDAQIMYNESKICK